MGNVEPLVGGQKSDVGVVVPLMWLLQVADIVNTSVMFKGVLYFKSCEDPS